jgi:SAM-dependent methyltransferase
MSKDEKVIRYYAERAPRYDQTYTLPMFTVDVPPIRKILDEAFSGKAVLEIACGTGHWTRIIAEVAAFVLATDVNGEMIEITRKKIQDLDNAEARIADAYGLAGIEGKFTGCFMGYFWSHVPRELIADLMEGVQEHLEPGSPLVMIDNRMLPDWEPELTTPDTHGNTYMIRKPPEGEGFHLIKNFPSETQLTADLSPYAEGMVYREFEYTWCLRCVIL